MTQTQTKKMLVVLAISTVLALAVYGTFAFKYWMFGATPFEYSTILATRYSVNSAIAMIQNTGRTTLSAAASLFDETGTTMASEPPAQAIPVLTYHRIVKDENDTNNVTVARFRDQMTTLKKEGWQTITLPEFEAFMRGEGTVPEKSFLLTFDDGAKDSFYPVDPILRSLGYTAAIYIIVESSKTPKSTYYLSPQEIQQVLRTGRWEIGSHSSDGHRPYFTNVGKSGIFFADKLWLPEQERLETEDEFRARVKADLSKAKSELQSTYHVPVNTFAFPLGNETGIEGSANFPEGASITEATANEIYDFGFLQGDNQEFTFNFPISTKQDTPQNVAKSRMASNFIVRRVHVDHDWDGARLLSILENGRMKSLPFEDDFSTNNGWISSWGSLEQGRNNFVLKATPSLTSASAFLDGSASWDNYSFDASVNWDNSYIFVMADVTNSKTYDACVFSEGAVSIQSTIDGKTEIISQTQDPRVVHGQGVRVGVRVHGATIECRWNFESISEAYTRVSSGGIGLQTWNETPGAAQLQVSSVIVRPYTDTTTRATQ